MCKTLNVFKNFLMGLNLLNESLYFQLPCLVLSKVKHYSVGFVSLMMLFALTFINVAVQQTCSKMACIKNPLWRKLLRQV